MNQKFILAALATVGLVISYRLMVGDFIPEVLGLALGTLPVLGMAVGDNVSRINEWKPPDFPEGKGKGSRTPIPWGRYFSLTPYLFVEFVMFAYHSGAYDQLIDFWKDWFLVRIPLVGDVVMLIAPRLTMGSLTVLVVSGFIVACPVILSSQMIKYGVLEPGFAFGRMNPVAKWMIGIPAGLYITAIGVEGYGMYYRMMSESVEQEIIGSSGIDPALPMMGIISVLTLGITTIAGFVTAKALHGLRDE